MINRDNPEKVEQEPKEEISQELNDDEEKIDLFSEEPKAREEAKEEETLSQAQRDGNMGMFGDCGGS